MTHISTVSTSFATLKIPTGPLSGLLLAARNQLSAAAVERGVEITISSDFEELLTLNVQETAAGTWYPMLAASNPRHRRLGAENGFWLCGRDAEGVVITVQAALLYDAGMAGIGRQLEDLTVFYDDPATAAGERFECRSKAAESTRGRNVFTLTGWTRPDWRGRKLFPLFHRASRLVSWVRWQPESLWGIVEGHAVNAWSEANMGPRHLDDEPTMLYQRAAGRHELRFLRFSAAQALGDLAMLANAGTATVAA